MSSRWVGPLLRSRLAAVASVYLLGIAVAGVLAAGSAHRLAVVLIGEVAPQTAAGPSAMPPPRRVAGSAPQSRIPTASSQTVAREASMLPLQDRWYGFDRYRGGMPFGSSSRGSWRSPYDRGRERNWWDDDEDRRPQYGGTLRSVCVRLCDGYYFPISFAVSPDRLQRDAQVCASRCGNQGRLFVHNNPGGSTDDMVDLAGRPYRQLKTAFLYRTEFVPSCKCQPDPWEAASLERHRGYALAAAARKGSKTAAVELQALQEKQRQDAQTAKAAEATPRVAQTPAELGEQPVMRLGTEPVPRPAALPEPSRPSGTSDWKKRAFEPN
jgi:hypothetical protein